MTSDFIRLKFQYIGTVNLWLSKTGLSWPPPERIFIDASLTIREATRDDDPDQIMRRVRMSKLTNEQAASMEHVARGAEYQYQSTVNTGAAK